MSLNLSNSRAAALLCACSAVAISLAQSAQAQTASGTPTALDEIVVTAQKRAENLQDVPASITALSSEALESRQIDDLTDLQGLVPSLLVAQNYGSTLITLRAISTGATSGAEDPSVAMHINGVYQPRSRSLEVAMMDLERVEVLAGPQGTLYGRNATGGVVNYIIKEPTREFEGEVSGLVGAYGRYAFRGIASGPVTDAVAFRISALWDDQTKGFTKNLHPGARQPDIEATRVGGVRTALLVAPTDTLRFNVDATYVNTKTSTSLSFLEFPRNAAFRTRLSPQTLEPHRVYANSPNANESEDIQLSGTATWDITDDVQFKSISALQSYVNHMDVEYDGSGFPGYFIGQDTKSHTFTQEFNVTSHAFDGRLTSIAGFFYLDDRLKAAADVQNNLSGTLSSTLLLTDQSTKSYSVFTDQTLSISDTLRVIGGIRYNKDKKRMTQFVRTGAATSCASLSQTREWDAWTPRLGAQYDLTPDIMAYVTWQKGFKAGGFAANTCLNSYDPEVIKGWESGVKAEFWDRRVRLNVAGYWYDYSNLQVQQALGVGAFRVVNAANSRIKGIEVSLTAAVTDDLRLDASGMVQNAKYQDFLNCNPAEFLGSCTATDPRPIPDRIKSVAGNWLNRAPPYALTIGVEYSIDVAGGDLLLRAESNWTGKVRYNEFNTPLLTQKAYDLQNAYLTYNLADRPISVRGFVKNIANTDYFRMAFYGAAQTAALALWAPPRTYGAEISYKF